MTSTSRAAWIRERRACVGKEVHNDKTGVLAAIPSLPQQQNVQGDFVKEVAFQQDKRRKRKFEALEFNNLCDHEIDSDFKADASAFFSKDRTKKQTMPGAFGAHVSGAARSVFCTVPQTSQIHLRTPA
jgi:hypothetical protein